MSEALQWHTVKGEPITIDGVTVTPEAQALVFRYGPFGFVWNRPVAILVEGGEAPGRIAITDITRLAQIAVTGAVVLTVLITRFLFHR